MRGELAALHEAEAASARFVERYRAFARGVVARELGAADDIVRAARRESRKEQRLAGERSQAVEALAATERDIARVDEQIAHAQGELRALHASERWRAVEEVGAAQARAGEQEERARRAESRVAELRDEEAALASDFAAAGRNSWAPTARSMLSAPRSARPARRPGSPTCCSCRSGRPRSSCWILPAAPAEPRCAGSPSSRAWRRPLVRTRSAGRVALDTAEAAERELRARRDGSTMSATRRSAAWPRRSTPGPRA